MPAGGGEDRSGRVEPRAEVRARRDPLALAEHGGRQAPEVEDGRDAGVEEGGEIVLDVGELRHLARRTGTRARMRVDVHEARQQGAPPSVHLGEAPPHASRWRNVDDPPIPYDDVAKLLDDRSTGRIEDAHVPQGERVRRSGRAGGERRVARAGRGEGEDEGGRAGCDSRLPTHGRSYHLAQVSRY